MKHIKYSNGETDMAVTIGDAVQAVSDHSGIPIAALGVEHDGMGNALVWESDEAAQAGPAGSTALARIIDSANL